MKKNRIIIELYREKELIKLYIKIPEEMETFFKELTNNTVNVSTKWHSYANDAKADGAKFYTIEGNTKWSSVEKQLNDLLARANDMDGRYVRVFNHFGDTLLKENYVNLAPLRTVGAKDGVTICADKFGDITMIDFETYINNLAKVTKIFWTNFVGKTNIKAQIAF